MIDLRPSGELVSDREQLRCSLLAAFNEVIRGSAFFESDEMAGRFLLDVVAFVLSLRFPADLLSDQNRLAAFVRNETLHLELYLREHLSRRRTAAGDLPTLALENIPTQPRGGDLCD